MNMPTNKFPNLRFPAADMSRLSSPGGFHARGHDAAEIKFFQTDADRHSLLSDLNLATYTR